MGCVPTNVIFNGQAAVSCPVTYRVRELEYVVLCFQSSLRLHDLVPN